MSKKQDKLLTAAAVVMCALGAIFYCYEYYLRVAPSVMSTELKRAFSLGEAGFGHLTAFYYYAYMPMQIPVGMMMDRFGPRRILTVACFLCTFGTYLFASTNHLHLAQLGRFLVGLGSAFAYVGVLKLSNIWLPRKYFAMMAGICTALGMLGAISGEVAMSRLVIIMGWQSTLHYSVMVGLVLTVILWFVLRDEEEAVETSHPHTTLDDIVHLQFDRLKKMVKSPQMWISGIIGCLTFLPISGFAEVWAVQFLEVVGMSKSEAAIGSSMVFLGFALGGPIWGIVSDMLKRRRILLIAGSFISAILMALAIFFPSASLLWMYSLLFFSAFFASVEILIFAVSNDLSRPSVSATAVAFVNMVVMIGGVSPAIIGKLLDNTMKLSNGLATLSANDYSSILSVFPIALILSGILSCLLKESYRRHN